MISQTTEYALRAVVFLADEKEPRTTAAIAEVTQIPVGYLAKVMQGLSKAGIVRSRRGLHGGFVLVESSDVLTVLKVINAVEPIRRYPECPLGLHGKQLCPLHSKLDQAAQQVEDTFGDTTIRDMIDVPQSRRPLCQK
ncbi:MAG: Rrf2 family transcriptional regulator [Pirellulaceae bacterium]